jgi:hypothetical protein
MDNDIIDLTEDMGIIELTPEMRVLRVGEHFSAAEIEARAKAVLAARGIRAADYDNSFDINHCVDIGCNKAQDGCCLGYHNPIVLLWHKQGLTCPAGPYQASAKKAPAVKINPLKASKRANLNMHR